MPFVMSSGMANSMMMATKEGPLEGSSGMRKLPILYLDMINTSSATIITYRMSRFKCAHEKNRPPGAENRADAAENRVWRVDGAQRIV